MSFYFLLLVISIQMLQWRQIMSIQYLKLNPEFYDINEIENYVILNTLKIFHFG